MPDFTEMKQRMAAVWSNGEFEEIAETLRDMHTTLVHVLGPRPGEHWLDIGCGTGNLAELAAPAGVRVTGLDIAPRMIDVARARAETGGYDIDYRLGDAENLDLEDATVDAVVSSVGMIFAPDHGAVANEVARVPRPGGRIAFSAWTPDGSVGRMFEQLAPYQPPPPPGAGGPLQWGSEEYVRERLGDAFELRFDRRLSVMEEESVERAWEVFSTRFGPTKTMLENMPAERAEELKHVMLTLFRENEQPDGRVIDKREYLLVTGTRR